MLNNQSNRSNNNIPYNRGRRRINNFRPKQNRNVRIRNQPINLNKDRNRNRNRNKIRGIRIRQPRNLNISRKLVNLTREIRNLQVTKPTSLIRKPRKMKEPRRDKIMTPMYMSLHSCITPIYEQNESVVNTFVYTRFDDITTSSGADTYIVILPYSINFNFEAMATYDTTMQNITYNSGSTEAPEIITPTAMFNIFKFTKPLSSTVYGQNCYATSAVGIPGNYKLIGTTIKVYNVTSQFYKSGDFIAYKTQDNQLHPIFSYDFVDAEAEMATDDFRNEFQTYMTQDFDQITIKNNYSCNDTLYINDYNTSNGSNIYCAPYEYLGCKFNKNTGETQNAALYDSNPLGNSTKYILKFPATEDDNKYIMEIWQTLSIIPSVGSNLGNLGKVTKHHFTPAVVNEMKNKFPFTKA